MVYIALATLALNAGFRTPWLTVLGGVAMLAAVAEFLFPTTYRLDAAGASVRGPLGLRRLSWPAVRSAHQVDREALSGVIISPVVEPGLARRMRSLWLPAAASGEPTLDTLMAWVGRLATERVGTEVTHG